MNEQLALSTGQAPPSQSMLALIDRAARDPAVDVAKMERLLAMAEQLHAREAKSLYDQAMNAAQGEMRPISRDCHNPQTRSKYASYEAIDTAIRPIYTEHGFSMSFGSRASTSADRVVVTCRVSHRGGHTENVELEMPADGKGARGNDVMTKTHATGSALSYAKRYITNLVWNLSFGEADDDGNAAGRRPKQERSRPMPRSDAEQDHPEPEDAPARKTPEKPVSERKMASSADVLAPKATDKTREWMLRNLNVFNSTQLALFTESKGWLSPEEPLGKWPLEHVPVDRGQLGALIAEITAFSAENEPPLPDGDSEDFAEEWWDVTITVPRAGMKRADYMVNPDTVRSLYEATKAGDESAKRRLFGLAKEWEPREWEGRDGKMHPPSREDVECREALDAFLESRAAKATELHNFEEQPKDLVP